MGWSNTKTLAESTGTHIIIDTDDGQTIRFTFLYGISTTAAYKALSYANSNDYWIPQPKYPGISVLGMTIPPKTIIKILNELFGGS